jgi:CheY-like chemotaxis protein/signal transduction histidine kinase
VTGVIAARALVAQEWIVSLLESGRNIRNTLILENKDLIANELTLLRAEITERAKLLQQLKKLSDDTKTEELFDYVDLTRATYLPLEQDFIKLIEDGDYKEARIQLLTKSRPAQLKYIDALYKYIEPARRELESTVETTTKEMEQVQIYMIALTLITIFLGAITAWWVGRSLLGQIGGELKYAVELANRIAIGERNVDVVTNPNDKNSLLYALKIMADSIFQSEKNKQKDEWIKTGLMDLGVITRRELTPTELAREVLSYTVERVQGVVGALYYFHEKNRKLHRMATFGLNDVGQNEQNPSFEFMLGHGLVGAAAQSKKISLISPLPKGYFQVESGTGSATPANLLLLPLSDASGLVGVLEIASFQNFDDTSIEYLEQAREALGIGIGSALARQRTIELLVTTQAQGEELQAQQEELEANNKELRLHTQILDEQRRELDIRNEKLIDSNKEVEWRAQELERVSRYKSEFLANMSHELRTPLNSMLMLSSLLQDNREQTLNAKQIKFAGAIHAAGMDLLALINDILDLSKIEAGQVDYLFESFTADELCSPLMQMFLPLAQQKGVQLVFDVSPNLPEQYSLDLRRTQQVLKNLLSNALKFTAKGRVELKLDYKDAATSPLGVPTLAMDVIDSGIGIASDKQALVFEAFKQADGGITRSYGGTGLGLSISRQLALGMQGQLNLVSQLGQGSTFTLLLPLSQQTQASADLAVTEKSLEHINDSESDPVEEQTSKKRNQILIIEDDKQFLGILVDRCQQQGLVTLTATDGLMGLKLAEQHLPVAILLDVMMPKLSGWEVMRHLQSQALTKQIPVHFITALDESDRALRLGAASYSSKPIDINQLDTLLIDIASQMHKQAKRVLVVEDDPTHAFALSELLRSNNLDVEIAESTLQAQRLLAQSDFDAVILDLGLNETDGEDLLRQVRENYTMEQLPVLVHSGIQIDTIKERNLLRMAQVVIVKGEYSTDRVIQELRVLLGMQNDSVDLLKLNAPIKLESVVNHDQVLTPRVSEDKSNFANLNGRTILLADDDIRNVFAISSLLTYYGVTLLEAENGQEALDLLVQNPKIELILMDIMMPVMDGYTAMREIRTNDNYSQQKNIPIIAMTAKTMPGDRESCITAGASDYIAKPINNEILLSMMQVWLATNRNLNADG